MIVVKITCLLLAVLMTVVNMGRLIGKNDVPAINFILQAMGITGFIACQWLI